MCNFNWGRISGVYPLDKKWKITNSALKKNTFGIILISYYKLHHQKKINLTIVFVFVFHEKTKSPAEPETRAVLAKQRASRGPDREVGLI